jgi:hypothetical protein
MLNPTFLIVCVGIPAVLLYLLVFGVLLPGRVTIYAFIAATFLFPNYGTHYFGFGEVPPYFFLEVVGAITILLALVSQRKDSRPSTTDARERWVCGVLALTVAAHYVMYFPLRAAGYYPPGPAISSVAVHAVEVLVSFVFWYGCIRFITRLDQVEVVAWVFVLCGVELLAERVVFSTFHLLPSIGRFAFDEVGRFKSLTENDPLSVGIYASVAMLCALYFAVRRQHYGAMLLVIPFWMLALTVYQRTFIVAPFIAAGFFVWKVAGPRLRWSLAVASVCALPIVVMSSASLAAGVGSLYAGTWRDHGRGSIGLDPLSIKQLQARFGIQSRALDVFVDFFPFGTGEFVQRDYLSASAVPARFRPSADVVEAFVNYEDARTGLKPTEVHNGYLEHVVAYGMLGVVGLIIFLGTITANYFGVPTSRRIEQALVYSILAFFAVFFLFYSFPKVYVAYLFFFHATFLLRRDASTMEPV